MSDKRTLKVAMVGLSLSHAGTVGPEQPGFMRQFHHLDGVEVTAFCEWRNTDFLKDAEKHFPAAGRYDNLDDLIEKEDFDLACVCVSPSQMAETLLKLSEAGKHYFVDKPLTLSADDLVPAVRAVNDNGLTTFLGYPYRFFPPAMELRALIDQGILGKPLDIESRQFTVQVGGEFGKPAVSVRYTKDGYEVLGAARTPTEGGGILHFIGCHHLELLRYVMGSEVTSVQAMMGRPQGYMEEPLEEIAVLGMEFENGAYGCLHHGYTKPVGHVPQGYDSVFAFRGTEGWAEWTPVGSNRLEVYSVSPQWEGVPEKVFHYEWAETPQEERHSSRWPAGHAVPTNPEIGNARYHRWFQRFIDDIRSGQPGLLNMNDALSVMRIIDAAYESGRTGRRVDVIQGY